MAATKIDMDLADVVKEDRKGKKGGKPGPKAAGGPKAGKAGGIKVGKPKGKVGKIVRDPNMTKLQQQAKKIRQRGKGAKPGAQPVVASVMKRAAQARQKIQQSKDARKSKVAQARGIPVQQNKKKAKPQIVKLQPTKQNQPFVFRGGNRSQQGRGGAQNQVPLKKQRAGQKGQGGIRVVVSAQPGAQNRKAGRGARRGRGAFGGFANTTAQRQQTQVQQRKTQVAQARRQNVNQRRGLIQPHQVAQPAPQYNNRGGGRGRGRGFGGNRGGGGFRGGAQRARGGGGGGGGGGVIRIVRR